MYSICYPDYPEDNCLIKSLDSVLFFTSKNYKIFQQQEIVRNGRSCDRIMREYLLIHKNIHSVKYFRNMISLDSCDIDEKYVQVLKRSGILSYVTYVSDSIDDVYSALFLKDKITLDSWFRRITFSFRKRRS